MEKRKDVHFSPEEQIDFVKLIEVLDWTKEVSPIDLVRAANKVAGLKGRRKYETNEVSYGLLLKSFEARVSKFTDTRFHGKDRFYTLKKECTKEQLLHFAKTGEMLEIKKELGRKDSKYYAPYVPEAAYEVSKPSTESKKFSTKKRDFPDEEAYMKASIVLGVLSIYGGTCLASEFVQAREKFGWKTQRSIHSKLHSIYQETNEICTTLFDKDSQVILVKTKKPEIKYKGDVSKLESNAKEICSLIVDDENKKKVIDYLEALKPKEEEPKVEVKVEEPKTVEVKVEPQPKQEPKTQKPRIQVIAASPEQGKSEYTEIKPSTPPFESSRVKWQKSLIAGTMVGATRGTYFNYLEMSTAIKKTRFVDVSPKDIREIINDLNKQSRGFIREMDFTGFTIGSEVMCRDFYDSYLPEKITEIIFLRLHMSLDDLQDMYPNLLIRIASEIIPERDNIFEIEMNRGEKAERDFAKLLFRMRPGEIVLESPNNWTMRRARVVMEKLGFV